MRSIIAVVIAALAVLTGCAPSGTPTPTSTPTSVTIPGTPVGMRVEWILDVFNGERDTTPAQWEPHLHDSFLAEVSADEVADLVNQQVRPARPLVPIAYRGAERDAVVTIAGTVGDAFDLTVVLDDADLITGLWLAPAAEPRAPARSLEEVRERFAALPGDVRVLVRDDTGADVLAIDADEPAPLASVFKLYVLGAVVTAIERGSLAWDDTVVMTDETRSLPSGELQDAPTGTAVTVRDAAQQMIAISDNTATDLLIGAVGRDAVEEAVAAMGHHEPAMLRPFLSTRELFALRWGGHDDLADRWRAGDEAQRRAVLTELDGMPFDVSVEDLDAVPGWHDLEWFATASDVAAAHEWLHAAGARHPGLREILGANPGVHIGDSWRHVAFKGGSEPGVLTGSWLAGRADGSTLTIVVLASSDREGEVEVSAGELFGLVDDLLVLEERG